MFVLKIRRRRVGMESALVVEGFKKSIEMHNLIYGRLIADDDRETAPYGAQFKVQKIKCKNHILRNFMSKIKEISRRPRIDKNIKHFFLPN
jgi:hypothetical protein